MILVGRYHKVRRFSRDGLGPPCVLDRRWSTIKPYTGHEEWERIREIAVKSGVGLGALLSYFGMIDPASLAPLLVGAIIGSKEQTPGWVFGVQTGLSASVNTLDLDSNYVAGTGGDACGARVKNQETLTLNSVYYCIAAFLGTAANVNDIDLELRPGGGTPQDAPDTTVLTESKIHNPSSTTGWHRVTGWTSSLTGGTYYWILIGDADGNITDRARCFINNREISDSMWRIGSLKFMGISTTNGFTTGPTKLGIAVLVLGYSDGTFRGCPFSQQGNSTNNSLERGMRHGGFTEQLTLFGMEFSVNSTITGCKIYDGATNPGGTTLVTSTAVLHDFQATSVPSGAIFSPLTIPKATAFRAVTTHSGSANLPFKHNIGTGADANLRSAMLGGGSIYWTQEAAGPVWSDDADAWPDMALWIEDQVAVSGGGAGGARNIQIPGMVM